MNKQISIITYNREYLLQDCIDSLNAVLEDSDKRSEYTINVFDDCSGDGTSSYLEECKSANLIDNYFLSPVRLGVSKNSNRAIRYFKQNDGDILYILNDDIIFNSSPFEFYEEALEKTDYHHFVYTDKYSPNKPSTSFFKNGIEFIEYRFSTDGVFLVLDKKAIEVLGGFNPAYFFKMEHLDLTNRAYLAGLTGEHHALDVKSAEGTIKVCQYYNTSIPTSLEKANGYLAESREIYMNSTINPQIYYEI